VITPETLSVWAPRPQRVAAVANGHRIDLVADENHWWRPTELPEALTDAAGPIDYGFLLDDDPTPLPDPRSRYQPHGVHGLSQTYDPSGFTWHDQDWTGRQAAGLVIYELHVGTFTPEGTLAAAIAHLQHLVDLGVDAVELMPVNAFNGEHNWGYDGVGWYAVQHSYGGPQAYQEFVDACHQRGIAVIQDVVYNHLGPSGNYLPRFGPYLSDGRGNTWGESVNLDGSDSDEVRAYIIENALMWLRDYHVDGLRLDAVHALSDNRARHILEELAIEVDALSAHLRRPLTLIAESDLNDPRLITSREAGGYGLAGQWSDDFHHAVYANLTGDTTGYYADFGDPSALAKVIERGYFHDGIGSSFRGRSHGRPLDQERTPSWRLVVCWDNHDQIGNRAAGQRLSSMLDHRRLQLAMLLTLLSPFTPMIFMGEEWGASTPWQFFSSHPEPELGRAVAEGRLQEFAAMGWDPSTVPDPQDRKTFERSKLDWSEPGSADHAALLTFTGRLLRLRRRLPDITDPRFHRSTASADDVRRTLAVQRGNLVIVINFADTENSVTVDTPVDGALLTVGEAVFDDARSVRLGAHSAVVARTGQPL
jgi:maltooligosyltrehalose trehalohydrolase